PPGWWCVRLRHSLWTSRCQQQPPPRPRIPPCPCPVSAMVALATKRRLHALLFAVMRLHCSQSSSHLDRCRLRPSPLLPRRLRPATLFPPILTLLDPSSWAETRR